MFGGGLTVLGLIVAFLTYRYTRRRRPAVFPLSYRPGHSLVSLHRARQLEPAQVLLILPRDPEAAEAVVRAAAHKAQGRPVAFLYRGEAEPERSNGFMEIADPYLKDYAAQDAFARAESLARKAIPDRRYIYVPGNLPREAIGAVWREVFPAETILVDGDQDVLPSLALERVRRAYIDGTQILHLVTGRLARAPASEPRVPVQASSR
jgi:hypothetical protein